MKAIGTAGNFKVVAHAGDAKTLLAFDLPGQETENLAGFTIEVQPPHGNGYYIYNTLQFERPSDHAQMPNEPAYSSVNAPIHKFRWVHVPGLFHQGLNPQFGTYRYVVTPRYFVDGKLGALRTDLSATVEIHVGPFRKDKLSAGFTRGYVQSQSFVRHFGDTAKFAPDGAPLVFDTGRVAGAAPDGQPYTYRQMYEWCGFTAREMVLRLLSDAVADSTLTVDVFAYDLNEPDVVAALLKLADEKRVRIILDNASLHSENGQTPEDQFETRFKLSAPDRIRRGRFGRYAHDKVFIVYRNGNAEKVLTGSTNFSVTGMYANSNHVLQFDDPSVAATYAGVFEQAWNDGVKASRFIASNWSASDFQHDPATTITFSPHTEPRARDLLKRIVDRAERQADEVGGCVFFAMMELSSKSENPVYTSLNALHADDRIFSLGISDKPTGIYVYEPGTTKGVLVTGKPGKTVLPKPFGQVPGLRYHQIHHKFVIAGFGTAKPVVFCGSSNLALGGEKVNGDNLLQIEDEDVVTAFTIEALALVDHFQFLNRLRVADKKKGVAPPATPAADKQKAARQAQWFLGTTDAWKRKYYDPADLNCRDRLLFAR